MPLGSGDMTESGLHVGVCLAKGTEVLIGHQDGGGLVHQLEVEGIM